MPKIAVIYTGELRTIETTIDLFKKNVLKNEDYHVFALLQEQDNYLQYESFIKEKLGSNLKTINWLNKYDPTWVNIREKLLENININPYWKNYLRNSGSMIEYYQSFLAFSKIKEYEKINGIEFDFVLRFRTDTVLKDPIEFDMTKYTHEYIKDLLSELKDKFQSPTYFNNTEIIESFMTQFMIQNRDKYSNIRLNNIINSEEFHNIVNSTNEDEFINKLHDYIHNGKYIITIRENIIYFIKRKLYEKISHLGNTFGRKYDYEEIWFNAECQLKAICVENNIDFFSSFTFLEDISIGYKEYDTNNYYTSDGELNNNEYTIFIKRR